MKQLNLLKLHVPSEDLRPQSWICVRGDNLLQVILKVIDDIKNRSEQNLWKLCESISKKLNCHINTVHRPLYGKRKLIPLSIISKIIDTWKEKCEKSESDVEKLREQINQEIEYLKVNNPICSELKGIKEITPDLAKLLGAHAADGMLSPRIVFFSEEKNHLRKLKNRFPIERPLGKIYPGKKYFLTGVNLNDNQNKKLKKFLRKEVLIKDAKIKVKHGYRVKIVDSQKNALKAYQRWLNNCFGKKSKVKKLKTQGAYEINFKDKIIARYFNLFFEFPYGKKSQRVVEPALIKNSSLEVRKGFMIGLMTFDGSVNNRGTVGYTSRSKELMDSVSDFLRKMGFKPRHFTDKRLPKRYDLRIYPKNEMEISKLSEYFIRRTAKWFRLKIFTKNLEFITLVNSEDEALKILARLYPRNNNKITIKDVFNMSRKFETFDIPMIKYQLMKKNNLKNIENYSVQIHLDILKKLNILKMSFEKKYFIRNCDNRLNNTRGAVLKRVYSLNPTISSWRLPDFGD